MTQEFNPLMDFARKVECSVRIPSNGNWYDTDMIEFNPLNEVDILPMLPNDEVSLVNPETLVTGSGIISLLKSCCPSIKNPEELYYPDVNALLLGIKKATNGSKLVQEYICPKCWSKKEDIINKELVKLLKERYPEGADNVQPDEVEEVKKIAEENCKENITKLEKENKILITPQEVELNIDEFFSRMTTLPKECVIELDNGLKIYATPYKCIDKIKFTNQQLKYQKITKYYQQHQNELNNIEEIDEGFVNTLKDIAGLYTDATDSVLDILASSIKYIVTPSGEKVENKEFIQQYIKSSGVEVVNKVQKEIDRLNQYGIPQTFKCHCDCCGYDWDEKFYGFNQSDFFGISFKG